MTADIATTLQQLIWGSSAFLVFLTEARPAQGRADEAESVLLFRSEGFAEDLGETHPCR